MTTTTIFFFVPPSLFYRLSGSVISKTALTSDDGYGGLAGGRHLDDLGGSGGAMCGGSESVEAAVTVMREHEDFVFL